MPRARKPQYDSPEFVRRYADGETLASLAAWLGVHVTAVHKAARVRGWPLRVRSGAAGREAVAKMRKGPADRAGP